MVAGRSEEARQWAADKRDFVADARDEAAAERDTAADARDVVAGARDALADAREAELDRWQERLEEHARALGLSPASATGSAEREAAAAERLRAGAERDLAEAARRSATAARHEAAERRLAQRRETLLAAAFAGIAEHLCSAGSADEVLTRVAEAAVATVTGATMASVTLRSGETFRTGAATDPAAAGFDEAQFVAGQGPSLDAFDVPLVDAGSYPDERWPLLSGGAGAGVGSSLSYHLSESPEHPGDGAALNVYAEGAAAFDDEAREIGFILAAHASLAARSVGDRITLAGLEDRVQATLLSRDVIGQAKGILMERLKTTPEEAFDILRRASQRLNVKLREVAATLAETGELDQG